MIVALDVTCPYCGAEFGERCHRPDGTPLRTGNHVARNRAVQRAEAESHRPAPLKIRWGFLPKLKYKVRDRHHIWCDVHGSVHETNTDPFGEGSEGENICEPKQWRRIYIESDDRNEMF